MPTPEVSFGFYRDTYKGCQVGEADFDRLARRAADMLLAVIGAVSCEDQVYAFQMAVCAQADFLWESGEEIDHPLSGFTVGQVTVRASSGRRLISSMAEMYLMRGGLTGRRVEVI